MNYESDLLNQNQLIIPCSIFSIRYSILSEKKDRGLRYEIHHERRPFRFQHT